MLLKSLKYRKKCKKHVSRRNNNTENYCAVSAALVHAVMNLLSYCIFGNKLLARYPMENPMYLKT